MVSIMALILLQTPGAIHTPPALRAAIEYRRFVNARIEWTAQSFEKHNGRQLLPSQFESTLTRHEWMQKEYHPGVDSKFNTLYYDGNVWSNSGSLVASVHRTDRDQKPDLRSFGMSPAGVADDLDNLVGGELGDAFPIEYSVEHDGQGLVVVTATSQRPAGRSRSVRYFIDPDRNYSVVQCESLDADGQVTLRSKTKLREVSGVWFPESIAVERPGRGPAWSIAIERAQINDPSLPESLSPKDIGVEPGTNVVVEDAGGSRTVYGWDGKEILNYRKMAGKIKRGEIELGPHFAEEVRIAQFTFEVRRRVTQQLPAPQLTDWELYVRRFIAYYGLDSDRSRRAWLIHDDCAQRAQAYLVSRKPLQDRIEALSAKLQGLPDTTDPSQLQDELVKLVVQLQKPIARIFERELKPRLFRILTQQELRDKGRMPDGA